MNKSDLVEALSEGEDLTKTKAEEIVNLLFDEMTNALVSGDRVEIRGLGSFKVKSYGGYKGRNPKTGKQIVIIQRILCSYFSLYQKIGQLAVKQQIQCVA